MFTVKHWPALSISVAFMFASHTHAEKPYVLGFSAALDSADGRSISALVNYSASESVALSADAGVTQADSEFGTLTNSYWDAAIEKSLRSVGIKIAAGQWGDKNNITSDRWSVGLFREFEHARLSVDYISQNLEVTFRSTQEPSRQTQASVNGTGPKVTLSVFSDNGRALWLSASQSRYDRPVSRLGQLRIARLLSPSSLSLTSTLLDHSVSAGADWPADENIWSLTLGRDRTAVDGVDVDSITLGWLTPLGARTDLDIGLGVSRDSTDTQVFLNFLLLRYGGLD